jgi:hypothetical protein
VFVFVLVPCCICCCYCIYCSVEVRGAPLQLCRDQSSRWSVSWVQSLLTSWSSSSAARCSYRALRRRSVPGSWMRAQLVPSLLVRAHVYACT